MQEVLNNQLVVGIKMDISRGEARLQELSTRYGDAHPAVRETRANLDELRTRLDTETRKVTGSLGLSSNVNRQREADVRLSLDAQRTRVLQLKAVRDEGLVIMRDIENAQRAYDTIQQRFTQTSLESQTTQNNISVLSQAVAPLEPASPKILLNLVLASFVGSLLAVGSALALEMRDRRVRSADDIVAAIDLPVIGVIAKPGSRHAPGAKSGSTMQQRLLAPLPQAERGA
jgi:uncharacterized protein involved in exopolysaccharide biosynthesis